MKSMFSRVLALGGVCAMLAGVAGTAMADPPRHVQIRQDVHAIQRDRAHLEMLHRQQQRQLSRGHYRAANRIQSHIDRSRDHLQDAHHELRHDRWHH